MDSAADILPEPPAAPPPAHARAARARAAQLAQAPQTLRALVRASEVWLVLLAAAVGAVAGLAVVAMNVTAQTAHELLYGLPAGGRLSAQAAIAPIRAIVPALGGLAMGLSGLAHGTLTCRTWCSEHSTLGTRALK